MPNRTGIRPTGHTSPEIATIQRYRFPGSPMKPPKPPIGVAFGSPCGDRTGPAIARYSSKVKSFASLRSTRPMSSALPLTRAIAASRPIVVGRAARPALTLEPADSPRSAAKWLTTTTASTTEIAPTAIAYRSRFKDDLEGGTVAIDHPMVPEQPNRQVEIAGRTTNRRLPAAGRRASGINPDADQRSPSQQVGTARLRRGCIYGSKASTLNDAHEGVCLRGPS